MNRGNHGAEDAHGMGNSAFGAPDGELNSMGPDPSAPPPGIVSVNDAQGGKKRWGSIAFLVVGIAVIGGLAFVGQRTLTSMKAKAKANANSAAAERSGDAPNLLNPEGAKVVAARPKLGGDSLPPGAMPSQAGPAAGAQGATAVAARAISQPSQGGTGCESIPGAQALRGGDGGVLVNSQGRATCIGADGKIISVPAIATTGVHQSGGTHAQGQGGQPSGAAGAKPASRYGGALFADGDSPGLRSAAGSGARDGASGEGAGNVGQPGGESQAGAAPQTGARGPASAYQTLDLLRAMVPAAKAQGSGVESPTPTQQPAAGAPQQQASPPNSVGSMLTSSQTVAVSAKRLRGMNLVLPKGRQIDCILTTRVINEVPGFTSCILSHDLYSADGSVRLVEKGSSLDGEYGNSMQNGQRRLFVVWDRIRTPTGVQVDLRSPGTDALGTSGVPGFYEARWGERIGTALLISLMNDLVAIEAAKQAGGASGGTLVLQQGGQYQNTREAGQDIAQQVIKQTINIKPTLYVNEGSRVAIYVARDVDFESVYRLNLSASGGVVPRTH